MKLRTYKLRTDWGAWRAAFSDAGLCLLALPRSGKAGLPVLDGQEGALGRKVNAALKRRLRGRRAELPWECFDLRGRSAFCVRVWKALHQIPFGQVRTYSQVAAAAGSPRASRAAGQACGANPIVLFIPCHRVIASGGVGGFGAGLEWKRRLLALEGVSVIPPGGAERVASG